MLPVKGIEVEAIPDRGIQKVKHTHDDVLALMHLAERWLHNPAFPAHYFCSKIKTPSFIAEKKRYGALFLLSENKLASDYSECILMKFIAGLHSKP